MMIRLLIPLAILALTTGCDAKRATEVIQLAPHATASMKPAKVDGPARKLIDEVTEAVQPTTVAEPKAEPAKWSATPPFDGKTELRLDRHHERVHLSGEGIDLYFELGKFSKCTTDITQARPPENMPASEFNERPVWIALQGDEEAASLRLSTRGALFVIDDGCHRVSDVTSSLIGARSDSKDPMFAVEPVAPDGAYDADDISLHRRGGTGTLIRRDGKPLLDVKHYSGERTLTASALEDQRWVTLLMAREWEYSKHDGSTGRDHTLAWNLHEREEPLLIFDNDYRYALDGIDSEQLDVRSNRHHPHDEGLLSAVGRRTSDHEMNVELACEEADEKLLFEYQRTAETVRWRFKSPDSKKSVNLGTARLNGTFATGCLDEVKKRANKRRKNLTKGAPKTPVRWKIQ